MVRYKAFNVKLLATDALILALCLLIGSQLFFVTVAINYLIIGITLALAMLFGLILSRSVRREVAQREGLQVLSDQLSQANTKLTEVSHFKTQLLSIASHQIKAPLAALKGYLELIFEKAYGEIPEPLVKPLTSMRASADGLVELITSLLDLRKIDEGKMDYQFTRNDLTEIVKGVVGELQLLATGKQLALTASGLDAPVWVQADVPKLKQVIVNLVDNAIKYTPSGSVSVTLAAANRHAIVEVADTGLGMSPALLPRLFDEFTRDQRVQRTIRGTGLGLYIAKRIIEAHGGSVVAHSDGEGMGSRFTVTLPLDLSN
jgi:signal transduction histidine kinase